MNQHQLESISDLTAEVKRLLAMYDEIRRTPHSYIGLPNGCCQLCLCEEDLVMHEQIQARLV